MATSTSKGRYECAPCKVGEMHAGGGEVGGHGVGGSGGHQVAPWGQQGAVPSPGPGQSGLPRQARGLGGSRSLLTLILPWINAGGSWGQRVNPQERSTGAQHRSGVRRGQRAQAKGKERGRRSHSLIGHVATDFVGMFLCPALAGCKGAGSVTAGGTAGDGAIPRGLSLRGHHG